MMLIDFRDSFAVSFASYTLQSTDIIMVSARSAISTKKEQNISFAYDAYV